jgi:hypothetical protein
VLVAVRRRLRTTGDRKGDDEALHTPW